MKAHSGYVRLIFTDSITVSLTFPTYDNEADSGKGGGTSYYEDLKKEVSLQGQVGILLIKSVPSKK